MPTDDFGRTALHHAAAGGVEAAVELLLARDARVDAADVYGMTPLMLACGAEPPGSCARLLKAGASVAAADSAGNTALAYAVRRGRTQQANDLRAAGLLRSMRRAVAVPRGRSIACRVQRPMPTRAGPTWSWRRVAGTRRRLRDLLGRGADPNSSTPGGETALAVAIASDSAEAVSLLLAAGADASRADQRGVTPLGLAVRLGHESVVEVLLQHGANPNVHGAGQRLRSSSPSSATTCASSGRCWRPVRMLAPGSRKARRR